MCLRIVLVLLTFLLFRCGGDHRKFFEKIDAEDTGVHFANILTESDSINGLSFEYLYNGAGMAVGDVNNDGLKDIFFAGNMVSSALYLNQGSMEFKDISKASGISTTRWCTGVSMIDINNDGLKDIYVCVAGIDTVLNTRENIFFINQGIDEQGIPHFVDRAKEMGLNDRGYSTMGVFFDYDKDQDLDLFILTNGMEGAKRSMIRDIHRDGSSKTTDRLYRNDGHNHFSNISAQAGIVNEGYGLGVGLCDINQDGWLDIYCSDDFISNDLLYMNNQDGTFSERSAAYFKHFTLNGMGMDIADVNNDGLPDVMVLDMLPASNERQKMMLVANGNSFYESVQAGYHPQFLRNTLQLNRGKTKDGRQLFSEIGYLAGVYQTDWSWAPLFADFDNDGYKDLLITNGFRRDLTNLDYIEQINNLSKFSDKSTKQAQIKMMMDELPDIKVPNHIYKNNGDLTFQDKSAEWGFVEKTFTNGAAYADLDNDGDLDLIFNNLDQEAMIYKNMCNEYFRDSTHYLDIKFDSSVDEADKIGLKIYMWQAGSPQFIEYSPFRGYTSSIDEVVHFGLGQHAHIDSLVLIWPDGVKNTFFSMKTDTSFVVKKEFDNSTQWSAEIAETDTATRPLFMDKRSFLNKKSSISQSSFDFRITPTLLHSLTNYGPAIAVADIDGDGLDDFYAGGAIRQPGWIYKQQDDGSFKKIKFMTDSVYHDMGALFFDADQDGDQDLYVVSGGYRWPKNNELYQDRLYLNDGLGNFKRDVAALPNIRTSGSCVVAADYDQDGDLDLFVGGRAIGQNYPFASTSILLQNEHGNFIDRSDLLGDIKGEIGMVTSALWTDVNNDQKADLVMVGEWMPVTIFIQENDRFVNKTAAFGMQKTSGWWNSINGGDFDGDGDIDYVLGNYGLNSFYKASEEKPLEIYAKDFDHNGRTDPVITRFIDDEKYILHPLSVLSKVIPGIRNRFVTNADYSKANFSNTFTEREWQGSFHLSATMLSTIVIENVNGKSFKIHELPVDVQFAPVFGSLVQDLDGDGRQDIMLVGNSLHEETIGGYYDASYGNILLNIGGFRWRSLSPPSTNFIADGDHKSLAMVALAHGKMGILSGENEIGIDMFELIKNENITRVKFEPNDASFIIQKDGRKIKSEIYNGSGFLSASSRMALVRSNTNEITITKWNGIKRRLLLK